MRTIYHYQYTGWPDHGCPVDPGVVLNFVDQWNERARQSPSDAVIVHCRCARVHALVSTHSAGIGRTGTIIAIDLIVNQLRRVGLHAPVDVAHCVQMLREQRSGMVQTEQQYTFIYQALAHYVDVQAQMLDNVRAQTRARTHHLPFRCAVRELATSTRT
jgi:protein tyrosine phosphatase